MNLIYLMTRLLSSFILPIALLLLLPGLARAQGPGELDPSFGQGGIVTTNFLDENKSQAYALALQPDGKIVAAGESDNGSSRDFSLIRYLPDGSLDPSFDGDGKVTTDFGINERVRALALQPDGKIIAAGESYFSYEASSALARYHPDGSLDLTFGGDGKVITDLDNDESDYVQALAIQPDGKIIVAGISRIDDDSGEITLVRYNVDGSLDTSFGGDGKVNLPGTMVLEYRTFLLLQPDGKIIAAWRNSDDYTFIMARYHPDGSLDATFDGDGLVIGPEISVILGLALQPDGKIMVTGFSLGLWLLGRYNADGSLDPTFDDDGLRLVDINTPLYKNFAMILQPDGKIVGAGRHRDNNTVILVRYNPDGSLDTSFDGDGWLTTPLSRHYDNLGALALQPGGEIIVAGFYDGPKEGFALARYHPDGSPDLSFSDDGWVVTSAGSSYDAINALVLQPDGKIVAAGFSDYDMAVARYNPDGSLDPNFDGDGKVRTDFTGNSDDFAFSLALQPDGKIIIAGSIQGELDDGLALARYNPDGSLDPSFDNDGKVITRINKGFYEQADAVAVQADGKIIIAGFSLNLSRYDMVLARYNPDGSLDSSFDGDGILIPTFGSGNNEFAQALVLQPDGKIVVAGEQNDNLFLVRYNSDGTLDLTFDGDGFITTIFNPNEYGHFAGLTVQPDGKLIVAGSSGDDIAMARYNPDGSLDPTFDGDGKVTTKINEGVWVPALTLQPNGKILLAGGVGIDSTNTIIIRYETDGSLDSTFGSDGYLITPISDRHDWFEDIVLQPDGKIVAAGFAELPSRDFMMIRTLNPDMDLRLTKTVYPPIAWPGEAITYTLAFSNTGTDPARNVVITDIMPASVTVQTINSSGVAITQVAVSPAYAWLVQNLAPGEGGLITLTGQVNPALTHSGRFTNTATITADQDIYPANNTAVVGLEVTVPALAFDSNPYTVGEDATQATITVTLSTASMAEVTVDYATADGAAQAGSDYTATSGTLSFMTGITINTFTVPIRDDSIAEGNETVKLRLNHPSGASLAPPDKQATLTLLDDDTAGLRLPPLLTATEGITKTYQVYLASRPTAPVSITLTTNDQVEVKPTYLVFKPSAWSQPQQVIVTALADGVGEGNHTGTITHTLTSPDPVYASLDRLRLTVKLEETSIPLFLPILLRQAAP